MNKKNDKKELKPKFFDSKSNIIKVSIAAAVILIMIAILMFTESRKGQFVVKNHTDLNLEYVSTRFVDTNGAISDTVKTENIKAKKTGTATIEPVDLWNYDANCEVRIKFEGHDELLIDTGSFNDKFEGNIKVDLEKTGDPNLIKLKIKAGNGLLSTKLINCNETFTINLSAGEVYQ
jgi:hypothetical protein